MLTTDWDDNFIEIEYRLWRPETIKRLRQRLREELTTGRFGRDFEDKLAMRRISLAMVHQTISHHESYIAKYYGRIDGKRRIGIWHPRYKLYVAWMPGRRSHFKTCFRKAAGLAYLSSQLEAALIYTPRGNEDDV